MVCELLLSDCPKSSESDGTEAGGKALRRLSRRELLRLDRLRQRRFRRLLVRERRKALTPSGTRRPRPQIVVLRAPSSLTFSRNYDETVEFFHRLKERTIGPASFDKRSGRRRITHLDLSTTKHMTPAAALVLTAELHRWQLLVGAALQPKNVKRWEKKVLATLHDMGALDMLGYDGPLRVRAVPNVYTVIRLKSAIKADSHMVGILQEELEAVVASFTAKTYLYEGLFEAALNAVHHAYPAEIEPEFPYCGERWWATACWDPLRDELRFMMYDQGVGIPRTLPLKDRYERLMKFAAETVPGFFTGDHASLIRSAMTMPRSSTGKPERGKGLPQMKSVVDQAGGGRLRVFSGNAMTSYTFGRGFETSNHQRHIGGTLVEWSLPCAVLTNE